jgi:hypothetical protein
MEDFGGKLKKLAIAIGVFLFLVAVLIGPKEATEMGKGIVGGVKTGLISLIIFAKEMISELKK